MNYCTKIDRQFKKINVENDFDINKLNSIFSVKLSTEFNKIYTK